MRRLKFSTTATATGRSAWPVVSPVHHISLEIVFRREIGSRSEASKEEIRIKRMAVKGKIGLVDGG